MKWLCGFLIFAAKLGHADWPAKAGENSIAQFSQQESDYSKLNNCQQAMADARDLNANINTFCKNQKLIFSPGLPLRLQEFYQIQSDHVRIYSLRGVKPNLNKDGVTNEYLVHIDGKDIFMTLTPNSERDDKRLNHVSCVEDPTGEPVVSLTFEENRDNNSIAKVSRALEFAITNSVPHAFAMYMKHPLNSKPPETEKLLKSLIEICCKSEVINGGSVKKVRQLLKNPDPILNYTPAEKANLSRIADELKCGEDRLT